MLCQWRQPVYYRWWFGEWEKKVAESIAKSFSLSILLLSVVVAVRFMHSNLAKSWNDRSPNFLFNWSFFSFNAVQFHQHQLKQQKKHSKPPKYIWTTASSADATATTTTKPTENQLQRQLWRLTEDFCLIYFH